MGILMDNNIHAPTVTSGPTSGGAVLRDLTKLTMTELMQHKERVEEELSALSSVLSSHGANMNTPLTTFDGFPRDDIDVAQIRTIRANIIRLRYDHKEVMTHLERGLHAHFANLQSEEHGAPRTSLTNSSNTSQSDTNLIEGQAGIMPFATVNSVVPTSPADQAGLQAGDSVLSFGNINWLNNERLSKIAELVQQSEGRTIVVKVSRGDLQTGNTLELNLELIPRRNWGGRGLLGCHLVPL